MFLLCSIVEICRDAWLFFFDITVSLLLPTRCCKFLFLQNNTLKIEQLVNVRRQRSRGEKKTRNIQKLNSFVFGRTKSRRGESEGKKTFVPRRRHFQTVIFALTMDFNSLTLSSFGTQSPKKSDALSRIHSTTKLPKIVLRNSMGFELKTATSFQNAIYRAKTKLFEPNRRLTEMEWR